MPPADPETLGLGSGGTVRITALVVVFGGGVVAVWVVVVVVVWLLAFATRCLCLDTACGLACVEVRWCLAADGAAGGTAALVVVGVVAVEDLAAVLFDPLPPHAAVPNDSRTEIATVTLSREIVFIGVPSSSLLGQNLGGRDVGRAPSRIEAAERA